MNNSFVKFERSKIYRDPLYGNIAVKYKIIWDLIDTKEVQRLRRISQLSGVSMVFHTAEHSRFTHAIGTYHIANRMIHEVHDLEINLTEYEKIIFLCAALLHDIGHGPFSHAFEHVCAKRHEEITCDMICSEETEVHKVLEPYQSLAEDISGIISHKGQYPLIESLVSSQLDVDRLDYLNRDAKMTGATYGMVDVDRLIRVMNVRNNFICYRQAGVHAIENYLMSRYHMYWQIYYHPVARSYDIMLEAIFKRIKDLLEHNKTIDIDITSLKNVLTTFDLPSYIDLDDAYMNGIIKLLTKSKDQILADLCQKVMNRKLFAYIPLHTFEQTAKAERISEKYLANETLKRYYFKEDAVSQATYLAYLNTNDKIDINNILILMEDGSLVALDVYSPIVRGLISNGTKEERKLFYGKPSFMGEIDD